MCTVTAALNNVVGFGLWTLYTPVISNLTFSNSIAGKCMFLMVWVESTSSVFEHELQLTWRIHWRVKLLILYQRANSCSVNSEKSPNSHSAFFFLARHSASQFSVLAELPGLGRAAPGGAHTSAQEDSHARQRISTLAGLRKHLQTFLQKAPFPVI